MKTSSMIGDFILGAMLLGSAKIHAQDLSPLPKTPSVTVSNFMRSFTDSTATGPASVNLVDLIIVDAKMTRGVTDEIMAGTDWWNFNPGVLTSQSARLEGLSVKKEFGTDSFLQLGTIGLWGPSSTDQRTGYKNNLIASSFLGYSGAQGNFVGIRAGKKIGNEKISATLDAMAGTGDRGLTGGIAGATYPSLCHHSQNVCGPVGGVNVDWQSATAPGLKIYTQFTAIENGKGLLDERRLTGGGQYRHKAGPLTLTGEGEYTQGTHYQGANPNLDLGIATLAAEKTLGKSFGLRIYSSGNRAQGAMKQKFIVSGADLTYHGAANKFSADFHDESGDRKGRGVTVSWLHTFRHRQKTP